MLYVSGNTRAQNLCCCLPNPVFPPGPPGPGHCHGDDGRGGCVVSMSLEEASGVGEVMLQGSWIALSRFAVPPLVWGQCRKSALQAGAEGLWGVDASVAGAGCYGGAFVKSLAVSALPKSQGAWCRAPNRCGNKPMADASQDIRRRVARGEAHRQARICRMCEE